MKTGTIEHPKMLNLADHLGIEIFAAVGLMETLWHWTRRYATPGNIGKHSNRSIARGVGWAGDADVLIDGLVRCGWVDRHEHFRLIIHHWSHHAESSVHAALAKARQWFVDGTAPDTSTLYSAERDAAKRFYETSRPPSPESTLWTSGLERVGSPPGESSAKGVPRGDDPGRPPMVPTTGAALGALALPEPEPLPKPLPAPLPSPAATGENRGAKIISSGGSQAGRQPDQAAYLAAAQTARDALRACGVEDPALTALSRVDALTADEVRREWAALGSATGPGKPHDRRRALIGRLRKTFNVNLRADPIAPEV
jgi:hypothetical protein